MLNENVKKLLKAGMWDLVTCAGGKWNSRIICVLAALGTLRYSELRKQMGNITDAVLDDSEMLAQVHYVLVRPDHQGLGIAGEMIERIKERYKNYLYIEGMPEEKASVPFYIKHGFRVMENGAAIQICSYSDKR